MNNNGVDIDADAVRVIFGHTKGYPYFLQEYGYQIWLEAGNSPISKDDVEKISPEVERRLDLNFFDVRFDRVSASERKFLRVMAEFPAESAVQVSDVAKRMCRPVSAVSTIRASLIKKGMLYSPSHGAIAYTVPMFGSYMRRVMPAL